MSTRWKTHALVLGVVAAASAGTVLFALRSRTVLARASAAAPHVSAADVARPTAIHAEGRIVTYPGGMVTVGTEVGGRVARVHVREGQTVKAGDVLVELGVEEQRAALAEAYARVGEARAAQAFANSEAKKVQQLVTSGALAPQARAESTHERDVAAAKRASAAAAAHRLEVTLGKAKIRAPIDGVVLERSVDVGSTLAAGAPLVTIADLSRLRVEAEVDEYDVGRVAEGRPATIAADGFPGQSWHGSVEEIPAAVVTRRLRPQDPARPSDARVLLVKVGIDGPSPLKLGQRVDVTFEPR